MEYIKFENFIDSTQYGYTADTTSLVSGDAKYLRITDIVPYFVDKDRVPFCIIDASKVDKYLVHDGDVLIARTGATTGYNLVVDDSFKNYVFASYLIRFNYNRKKLYPRYLKYVLKSPSWYGFVNNYIGGSAQPGMNARVFGKYYLPYTDLSTQQKIATILSAYDSQIENNQKRIKLLEQMVENLYKEWFVRFRFPGYETAEFEGGVPKEWDYKPLGDIVSFERGLSYSSEEIDCEDGLNLVNLKNIEAFGGYRRDGLKHYNGKYKTAQIVKKGDLVMGVTDMTQDRRTVGAVALIPEIQGTSVISADLVKIVSKHPNLFLYCLCRFGNYSKFFTQFANGANVLHLKPNTLLNKKVLMPTGNLIKMFVEKVQASIECIDDLYKQIDLLTTQRDLLLPRLMSGKLSI